MTRPVPEGNIDLGGGFSYRPFGWHPDRNIPSNAKLYEGIEDIPEVGVGIYYGDMQWGFCNFDTPEVRAVFGACPLWQVSQREPLTMTPSILSPTTGLHGYITEGRWVPCGDSPDPESILKFYGA